MTLAIAQGGGKKMDSYLGVDVDSVTTKCAVSPRMVSLSPTITYVPRASRFLPDSRDSGEFRDNFPLSQDLWLMR
jgi:hypothetical protein